MRPTAPSASANLVRLCKCKNISIYSLLAFVSCRPTEILIFLALGMHETLETATETQQTEIHCLFTHAKKNLPWVCRWGKKLKKTGFRLGFIGLVCLNLLFLPVSRGSMILRVLDIPFEHAIKYHVWLGNFVMTIFTLHGLSYCIAWFSEGCLIKVRACWQSHYSFFSCVPLMICPHEILTPLHIYFCILLLVLLNL
jgi:hypothetical protein